MNKPWQPYARHILDAIEKIRYIEAQGDIVQDEILYAASLRHLQTLSEATQHLPADKMEKCLNIPWREISGFRNILVHNYLGDIDSLTIVAVIDNQLEPLKTCIEAMLIEA